MASPNSIPEITLQDVLLTLWRRRFLLLACVAIAVLAVLLIGGRRDKTYSASTQVLLGPPTASSASAASAGDAARTVANAVKLVRSDAVQKAAEAKGIDTSNFQVKNQTGSDVIEIHASAKDPSMAARKADTYAAAFIDLQRAAVASPLQASIDALNQNIDAIKKQLADPGAANAVTTPGLQEALKDQLHKLDDLMIQVQEARTTGGPRVISAASVPTSPSGANLARYLIVAILAGLVSGSILSLLVDHLRRRIYRPRELDRATHGITANLAVIEPKGRRDREPKPAAAQPATREAYRLLRTMVQLQTIDGPPQLIQVITPTNTGHSSQVTVGLARAAADAGQRVLVVCANFHNSALHELLGGEIGPGVTDVLNGDLNLTDAIQPVPGQEHMWLVPPGTAASNADHLAGKRALDFATNLRACADLVILESAPVLEYSDALEVSRVVDGTLLVVPKGSLASQVKAATELLSNANARLLGTVLFGAGHRKPHVHKQPPKRPARPVDATSPHHNPVPPSRPESTVKRTTDSNVRPADVDNNGAGAGRTLTGRRGQSAPTDPEHLNESPSR